MAAASQELAPWWFSGTIGLIGVIAGLLLKSLIDWLSTRASRRREDQLRFIQDKRVAYADLLAACTEVADVEHEHRLLAKQNREFDATRPSNDEIDDHNRQVDENDARRTRAYQALHRASAIVDLIAPEAVVAAADVFISRCHHPHLLPRRVEAEAKYVDEVRKDLGYQPTSHMAGVTYEPLIKVDDPESGV